MIVATSPERLRRALIALLPLALYAGSLGYPFQYDDFHSIVQNESVRSLSHIPAYFADPGAFSGDPAIAMYRPLLLVTYAANHAVSGYEVWSYRLTNVGLHAACAAVLYILAAALGLSRGAAALAAAVFAAHPVNVESVVYISSRSELLVGLLVLGGLLLHVRRPSAIGVPAVYGLALLTKSVAVVLPALCLAYDLLLRRGQLGQRGRAYGAMAALTALYLAGVGHFLRRATLDAPVRSLAEQVWSQIKALVFYARLLVLPRGLSVDHQFQISDSIADPYAGAAALVLISILVAAASQARRRPRVAFLCLWWLASLAPASAVPLNVLVNEHRLYLPSAAFGLGLGLCFHGLSRAARAPGARAWQGPAGAVLVGALWLLALQRTQVWASAQDLWESAARNAPLMARPHIMLAEVHDGAGQVARARAEMTEALRLDPAYLPGYELLARLRRHDGRLDAAESWLRRGLAAAPDESPAEGVAALWGELGSVLVSRARARGEASASADYAMARQALTRAVDLAPAETAYRNNLGNVLQLLNEPGAALTQHREALCLAPGDAATRLNLGNAHQMRGALDSAEAHYRGALEADAGFAGAWANLASVLERRGARAEALEAYERAASLDPAYGPLLQVRRQHLGKAQP